MVIENETQTTENFDATQHAEAIEFEDHVAKYGIPRKAYEEAQRLSLEMNLTDEQFEQLADELRKRYQN
ncbi:MAG: hypothetical protein AABX02_04420, partial [archaeon]